MGFRSLLNLLVMLALAAPCAARADASGTADNVQKLKWVDTADADKMLQADINRHTYHFYVVCGIACAPDPLDKVDALQCFPNARYLWLEGTSDTPASEEESRLLDKAEYFAWHYNMALAEYLSKHGMSNCTAGEDWERARDDMNRRLAEDDLADKQNNVTFAYDKESHRFRFVAYLVPNQRNDETYGRFCGRAAIDHLSGRIIIEIRDGESRKGLSSIECRYGQVVPSDWVPKPDDDFDLPGFELH